MQSKLQRKVNAQAKKKPLILQQPYGVHCGLQANACDSELESYGRCRMNPQDVAQGRLGKVITARTSITNFHVI